MYFVLSILYITFILLVLLFLIYVLLFQCNILHYNIPKLNKEKKHLKLKKTRPWELMDLQTKNDSDTTQDIRMPYVGNGCLTESELNK